MWRCPPARYTLVSEDNALMMGALLLFGVLGIPMWVTRKSDCYRMTIKPATKIKHAG